MGNHTSAWKARLLAVEAHGIQKYGAQPYVVHLEEVATLLISYGPKAQIVGYLHDTLEDTKLPAVLIGVEFGEDVKDLVMAVTDPPGKNRKMRKELANAHFDQIKDSKLELALAVKAADRLANLRECARYDDRSRMAMYRAEHFAFTKAVLRPGVNVEFFNEMDAILGLS